MDLDVMREIVAAIPQPSLHVDHAPKAKCDQPETEPLSHVSTV